MHRKIHIKLLGLAIYCIIIHHKLSQNSKLNFRTLCSSKVIDQIDKVNPMYTNEKNKYIIINESNKHKTKS